MMYRFCKCTSVEFIELDFSDRFEVTHFVQDNINDLQTFAVHESGNIFGYAVELSDNKPTAMLYPHKVANLIWIDMN